ncbi:MAG: acetyltransferase [Halioglobus sp.]|nr:acetyltransferase [Halioglobus sp.]
MSSSKKQPLLVFGAGGHGKSVLDTLQAEGRYDVVGLIDSTREVGYRVLGVPVLGGESDLPAIVQELGCHNVFVAVGDNFQRSAISGRLLAAFPDIAFVTPVHPSAVVSPSAELGAGTVVMAGAVINAQSVIHPGCIINTRASVDHDCTLAPFSSVAPGATLGGGVVVGQRTAIGLGSSVSQQLEIGADTVIGTGACVVSGIPASVVAYGCPCKVMRSRKSDERYL